MCVVCFDLCPHTADGISNAIADIVFMSSSHVVMHSHVQNGICCRWCCSPLVEVVPFVEHVWGPSWHPWNVSISSQLCLFQGTYSFESLPVFVSAGISGACQFGSRFIVWDPPPISMFPARLPSKQKGARPPGVGQAAYKTHGVIVRWRFDRLQL